MGEPARRPGTAAVEVGVDWIVVSGPPGSGKTTVARVIRDLTGYPLLCKDTIKESLMDCFEHIDLELSRTLGRAAVQTMYALARDSGRAVLESVWHRTLSMGDITGLGGRVLEMFCACDRTVANTRYSQRRRHPGHLDDQRSVTDLWNPENAEPVAGGWPVVRLPTDQVHPGPRLVDQVTAALAG